MKDILECYKLLGIEPGAAPERVRNAYLQLCRFYDPTRYVGGDPEHLANAELKRKEIDDAYKEIRHFLPALQSPQEASDTPAQSRDFKEMVDKGPTEVSKALVGFILVTVMVLIIGWGYYLYRRTRDLPKTQPTSFDPEAVPAETTVVPSTDSVPATPVE